MQGQTRHADTDNDAGNESWIDVYDIEGDARDALVKIDETLTTEHVREIADASTYDFDPLCENDEFVATYIADWKPYFDDLGIDDEEIQQRVMRVHKDAAGEIGLDTQQPLCFLVTSKN